MTFKLPLSPAIQVRRLWWPGVPWRIMLVTAVRHDLDHGSARTLVGVIPAPEVKP